VHRLNHSMSS